MPLSKFNEEKNKKPKIRQIPKACIPGYTMLGTRAGPTILNFCTPFTVMSGAVGNAGSEFNCKLQKTKF
jgi:hypothetical protein